MSSICVVANDYVPRYRDGGYTALIESIAPQMLGVDAFLAALNAAGALPDVNWNMFVQYASDCKAIGELPSVEVSGQTLPVAILRDDAPAGIGQDAAGIWFSTPASGTRWMRWYVNGALKVRRQVDLASNRSATKAELECVADDVVQLCIESVTGVVGWWGRITVA